MKIEVLYIHDCPGFAPTLSAIEQIVAEENIIASIVPIEVNGNTEGFLGSPTVRINGRDIEDGANGSCGLACRSYMANDRRANAPDREIIRQAIRRGASRTTSRVP